MLLLLLWLPAGLLYRLYVVRASAVLRRREAVSLLLTGVRVGRVPSQIALIVVELKRVILS